MKMNIIMFAVTRAANPFTIILVFTRDGPASLCTIAMRDSFVNPDAKVKSEYVSKLQRRSVKSTKLTSRDLDVRQLQTRRPHRRPEVPHVSIPAGVYLAHDGSDREPKCRKLRCSTCANYTGVREDLRMRQR